MQRPSAAGRWLDANAKWFLPLLVVTVIGAGFFGVLAFDGYVRRLPPYRMAMQELRSNREANDILGPPIQPVGRMQANFTLGKVSSHANLTIPVQGTRAQGRLVVFATAAGDDWTLRTVTLNAGKPPRNLVIVSRDAGPQPPGAVH